VKKLLNNLEQAILKDLYNFKYNGKKIDLSEYMLEEADNSRRIKEYANILDRLEKMGYLNINNAFAMGGRLDEKYHNNVRMILYEKISLSGLGINEIRKENKEKIEDEEIFSTNESTLNGPAKTFNNKQVIGAIENNTNDDDLIAANVFLNDQISFTDNVSILLKKGLKPFMCRIDSDTPNGYDYLNISNDINSIANLISMKGLSTPMAIGLFGKWGSGKSFLMNKIEDKVSMIVKNVEKIKAKAKKGEIDQIEKRYSSFFCDSIIQVKFNAWHYIDANLWASLVSHIFDKINERFGGKSETQDSIDSIKQPFYGQLESAIEAKTELDSLEHNLKKELDIKSKEINNLNQSIANKEKAISKNMVLTIAKTILIEGNVLETINEKIPNACKIGSKIKQFIIDNKDLITVANEVSSNLNKVRLILNYIKTKDKIKLILFITLFILLIFALNSFISNKIDNIFKLALNSVTGVIAIITPVITFIRSKTVKQALSKANDIISYLFDLANMQTCQLIAKQVEIQQQVSQLETKKLQIEFQKSEIETKIKSINEELEDIKNGKYIKCIFRRIRTAIPEASGQ
jgi:hypothetical protein